MEGRPSRTMTMSEDNERRDPSPPRRRRQVQDGERTGDEQGSPASNRDGSRPTRARRHGSEAPAIGTSCAGSTRLLPWEETGDTGWAHGPSRTGFPAPTTPVRAFRTVALRRGRRPLDPERKLCSPDSDRSSCDGAGSFSSPAWPPSWSPPHSASVSSDRWPAVASTIRRRSRAEQRPCSTMSSAPVRRRWCLIATAADGDIDGADATADGLALTEELADVEGVVDVGSYWSLGNPIAAFRGRHVGADRRPDRRRRGEPRTRRRRRSIDRFTGANGSLDVAVGGQGADLRQHRHDDRERPGAGRDDRHSVDADPSGVRLPRRRGCAVADRSGRLVDLRCVLRALADRIGDRRVDLLDQPRDCPRPRPRDRLQPARGQSLP